MAGLNSEKLYRATFICQYGLFCCMALVSLRLFCKHLGNLEEFFGQRDYRPPPPRQKIARTLMAVDLSFRGSKFLQYPTAVSYMFGKNRIAGLFTERLFISNACHNLLKESMPSYSLLHCYFCSSRKRYRLFFLNYLYLFSKVISCNNQFSCQQNTWR